MFQFSPYPISVSLSEMTEDSLQFLSRKIINKILFEDEHESRCVLEPNFDFLEVSKMREREDDWSGVE